MNIVQVKPAGKRFEALDISNLSIKAYGKNNLYPQMILDLIASSASATLCVRRMARFIEGLGFRDANLYSYAVNNNGDTMDGILKLVSLDYARFKGFALHVNYNLRGEIASLQHIPFEMCRLHIDDDSGYVGKIAIHPDWSGKGRRGGKALKVSSSTVDYLDAFNPIVQVVTAQIVAAGNIEAYKGQVMYYSDAGNMIYPTPGCDAVIPEMSTEEGLANVSYRNVRNNFLPAGMIVKKKATQSGNPDDNDSDEDTEFFQDLAKFQGDSNSNKLIGVVADNMEDAPKFISFDAQNFDKEFDYTENRTVEKIYAAYEQEKFYRIRSGSLYFSSGIAATVNNDYSDILISERQTVERVLTRIFKYWHEFVSDDFSITPIYYTVIEDETPDQQ